VATITQSHDLAAGPTPPSHRGGAERPADWAKLDRNQRTRLVDIWKKKQNRKETRALLQTLAELEAKERGISGPVHSRDAKLHTVMERLTRRLKLIAAKPPPEPKEAALSRDVVVAGMVGGRSLGTLYVCVEDWVVRSSNRAMELMCPYELLRGYVGLELTGVVHPDDHLQLALLQQEQVHSFQPGDTLVLSVRMLRACTDGGTLVVAWRRQFLEVANIARDEEHGGKLHVLFTCVLDADSVAPLTFDASDRLLFQEIAHCVSGTYSVDPYRTTDSVDSLSQQISNVGFTTRSETAPLSDLVSRLSHSLGRSLGIHQLLAYLKSGARWALTSVVRMHELWGLAPDGTPWAHVSAGLCAFGVSSSYHTYYVTGCTGKPLKLGGGADSPEVITGVFKPCDCEAAVEGGAAIGGLGMVFATQKGVGQVQVRRITCVGQVLLTYDFASNFACKRLLINFYGKQRDGALPHRTDGQSTRIAPPDPELLTNFLVFGPARFATPFPEFLKRRRSE